MKTRFTLVLACALASGTVVAQPQRCDGIQTLPYTLSNAHWQQQRQMALNLIAGSLVAPGSARSLSKDNVDQLVRELDDRVLYVSLQWLAAVANSQLLRFQPIRQQVGAVIKHALQVNKQVRKPEQWQHAALNDIIAADKYYTVDPTVAVYPELVVLLSRDAHKIIDDVIELLTLQPA